MLNNRKHILWGLLALYATCVLLAVGYCPRPSQTATDDRLPRPKQNLQQGVRINPWPEQERTRQ